MKSHVEQISVDTVMAISGCDRKSATALFKELDKLKIARYVKGRYPRPSRLERR